jgi:hypothetical protein
MGEPANTVSSSLASSRRRCPAENSSVIRAASDVCFGAHHGHQSSIEVVRKVPEGDIAGLALK